MARKKGCVVHAFPEYLLSDTRRSFGSATLHDFHALHVVLVFLYPLSLSPKQARRPLREAPDAQTRGAGAARGQARAGRQPVDYAAGGMCLCDMA